MTIKELEIIVNKQAQEIEKLTKIVGTLEGAVNDDEPGQDVSVDVINITKRLDKLENKNTSKKPTPKPKAPTETFIVNKKVYRFKVAYINGPDGKEYTKDLLKDKERLASIVTNNPYWVTEVTK